MPFVVKIPNRMGDGAGRSRYLLRDTGKVLAVSTNIPSPAVITGDYGSLADDFNRVLLSRQGDYRTDHFVVSFQRRFSEEELEEIAEIIEGEFLSEFGEDRPYLLVVHAEEFKNRTPEELLEERIGGRAVSKEPIKGTSFHVVLGRNAEGRGIRLDKRSYLEFKRRLSEKLLKYSNEREREVFQHFLEGKRERDYYKKGELYKPEKNEKVLAKKILKDLVKSLETGDLEKAVEILNQHNAEIRVFEVSPYNKKELKEPTPYLLMPRIGKQGAFAIRLRKAERVLYEKYANLFEEIRRESQRVSERVRDYLDRDREAESPEERAGEIYSKLEKVREIRENLGRIAAELSGELGLSEEELERFTRGDRELGTPAGNSGEVEKNRVSGLKPAVSRTVGEISDRRDKRRGEVNRRPVERDLSEAKEFRGEAGFGGVLSEAGDSASKELNRDVKKGDIGGDTRNIGQDRFDVLDGWRKHSYNRHSTSGSPSEVKSYYIGLIRDEITEEPVYRAVISDDRRVLQRLNAEHYREIEEEQDIAVFWSANECRGEVEIYIDGELPEWIRRGLEKAEWERTYQPPWSTVPRTEVERPTGIKRRKYFEIDGRVVLDRDIEKNPERYANCPQKEAREIAERIIRQREEERRREFEWLTRDDDRGIGRGLGR